MDWLLQNWVWIVVAVGGFYLISRMGMGMGMGMGGCGMGHSHGASHAGRGHPAGGDDGSNDRRAGASDVFDPVSQHMLPAESAIASAYRGRVYYFEDRTNRDSFESDPEKYLASTQAVGREIGSSAAVAKQSHQGHGCC